MSNPVDDTGFHLLAEGIFHYLAELEVYRTTCLRHEGSAFITGHAEFLQVEWTLACGKRTEAHLRSRLNRLSGWETSPLWRTQWPQWAKWLNATTNGMNQGKSGRIGTDRGVVWRNRAFLVNARAEKAAGVLRLAIVLPALPFDLPVLPLRELALVFEFQEFLLPAGVAASLPAEKSRKKGGLNLRRYLSRAMPQIPAARQCIFGGGAGHSRTSTPHKIP